MSKLNFKNMELFEITERLDGEPIMLEIVSYGATQKDKILFWTKEGGISASEGVDKDREKFFEEEAFGKLSMYGNEEKGALSVYNWYCDIEKNWKCNITFQPLYQSGKWGRSKILSGSSKKTTFKELKI